MKKIVLLFPIILSGIYLFCLIQSGCHLETKPADSIVKVPEVMPLIQVSNQEMPELPDVPALPDNNDMPPPIETLPEVEQKTEKENPEFLLPLISNQHQPLVLVSVDSNNSWMLAAAAPVTAKIRQAKKTPVLLSIAPEPIPEQTRLLKKMQRFTGSSILLSSDPNIYSDLIEGGFVNKLLPLKPEPFETGLFLAKSFWPKTDTVVMSTIEDSEAVILGSTLACHMVAPFIGITGDEDPNEISYKLSSLNVDRVCFVTSEPEQISVDIPGKTIEKLGIPAVQERLVYKLGSNNIKNLILFRVPDESGEIGKSGWMAPYLSLMRRSALIPCYSSDPSVAEDSTYSFIEIFSLKPTTVTLLADYDSLNMITVSFTSDIDDYELQIEPCSRPADGMAAGLGVGRIPFVELWASSTLIARNILREHIPGQVKPKALMIANPSTQYGPLPLCETVSRATAKEFKNLGIQIDEFYGNSSHEQAALASASEAQLIIFEGHVVDKPVFLGGYQEQQSSIQESRILDETGTYIYYQVTDPDEYNEECPDKLISEEHVERQNISDEQNEIIPDTPGVPEILPEDIKPMDGLPFVILQSCHSLNDSALDILSSEAIGIVGSVSNIHSASGSAFIKTYCDSLLYRDDTVGEALRDARNYLLCVSKLKTKRGHQQQAKVNRVAYSFNLWGDPEAKLFTSQVKTPKLQAVSADFIARDTIHITTPARRLPTSRTKEYYLRMFPGEQVAGIVKKIKDNEIRRIAPLNFFRIDKPEDFDPAQYIDLQGPEKTSDRTVFLTDPFDRFLYVLYYPEKDQTQQGFILQFVNQN